VGLINHLDVLSFFERVLYSLCKSIINLEFMVMDRSQNREFYKESVAEGLARGILKADGHIVTNDDGITGEEVMAKGDLRREIGELALTIHDRLVQEGDLESNASIRTHILRIIREAA